jgi:uncharacterized protein YndB with AHSA1/START domain
MAKSVTHTITYPKPVEEAWAAITNPDFQQGKLDDGGATNIQVSIDVAPNGSAELVLERDNPAAGVPSVVKKVVGETAHVIERVSWSAPDATGARTAELVTDFVGVPISMSGSLDLRPKGDVTDLVMNATFKAAIPLVGGKFEETALNESVKTLDAEQAFANRFMA